MHGKLKYINIMFIREKKKKTLSEFYTARESSKEAISSITNCYKYSAQQDFAQTKYITSTMSKQNSKGEEFTQKEKYRIFAGKLHVYRHSKDKYVPIERNYYIDLTRIAERKKNDYSEDRNSRGTLFSQFLHLTAEEPHMNPHLCSRETERQAKSTALLTSRSLVTSKSSKRMATTRNIYTSKNSSQYKTPAEILTERCLTSGYQLTR